ncbi:MAG: hypothetical protein BGO38_15870 [Cellulomonas sp. 73-145]|nr:MAG: hypothetical protein BGO38_15860 [Cellulomonas sp. 73-145]OJV58827.1 MAG: hypothetical protein BGO38_15870 [Cellulomonas sp. 73-145]
MESDSEPSRPILEPGHWVLTAVGFALLAAPVVFWEGFGTAPDWAVVPALLALGLAMVCAVIATVLRSRAEHVSLLRLIGRVLLAPIRLLFDLF